MADQDHYDDYIDDWIECWDCGGDGYYDDECECESIADQCFCETPTPRQCRTCKGEGGWEGSTNG
jgi:hypothetical protein